MKNLTLIATLLTLSLPLPVMAQPYGGAQGNFLDDPLFASLDETYC